MGGEAEQPYHAGVRMFPSLAIPLKYKLYAVLCAAFVLGLLRWRNKAVADAVDRLTQQQRDAADAAANARKEVRHEVEILDDAGLAERASKWVRNRND